MNNIVDSYKKFKTYYLKKLGKILYSSKQPESVDILDRYINNYFNAKFYNIYETVEDGTPFSFEVLSEEYDGLEVELLEENSGLIKQIKELKKVAYFICNLDGIYQTEEEIEKLIEEEVVKDRYIQIILGNKKDNFIKEFINMSRKENKILESNINEFFELTSRQQDNLVIIDMNYSIKLLNSYRKTLVNQVYKDQKLYLKKSINILNKIAFKILKDKCLELDDKMRYIVLLDNPAIVDGDFAKEIKNIVNDKLIARKLGIALSKLAEEDPTFKTWTDKESGQTIIAGMGELHLDIIVDRLKREFKVECTEGKPQVSYKETIKNKVKVQGKFVRQSGGHGQYGDVWFEMEPLEPGSGIVFENKIVGGAVPKEYIKPVEEGMREAALTGILAGYPVIDFKCSLVDGSYHEVDSSEMAFKVAASMAFKEGCKQAHSVLLEPIMKVEVTVPEEYMGDVIGDINARRGRMEGMEARGGDEIIRGFIPLSEMFGYATDLRSKTQGRGTYSMEPSHYEEVPKSILDKIVTARNKQE